MVFLFTGAVGIWAAIHQPFAAAVLGAVVFLGVVIVASWRLRRWLLIARQDRWSLVDLGFSKAGMLLVLIPGGLIVAVGTNAAFWFFPGTQSREFLIARQFALGVSCLSLLSAWCLIGMLLLGRRFFKPSPHRCGRCGQRLLPSADQCSECGEVRPATLADQLQSS